MQLPSIVVVGDQSSGKSTVVESISGVNLPRGQNITTRTPIMVRLINSTPNRTLEEEEKQVAKNNAAAAAGSATVPNGVAGECCVPACMHTLPPPLSPILM